jgi:hypothetical protein
MQAAPYSIAVFVPSASPSEDARSITTAEHIDLQSAISRAFFSGLQARRKRLRDRLRKINQQTSARAEVL